MSEIKVGDVVEIVDIEASTPFYITNDMRKMVGRQHRVESLGTERHGDYIELIDDGGVWQFAAASLRKVNPAPAPRKINILSVDFRYRKLEGITNMLIVFTVGNSHVQTGLETSAICSKSDTFKERTGRKIAMQRAVDILGVTMREIAEAM